MRALPFTMMVRLGHRLAFKLVLLHGMRIKSEQLQMYQNPEQEEMLGEIPVVGLQQLVGFKPLDKLLKLLNLQTLLNQSHHRLLLDL